MTTTMEALASQWESLAIDCRDESVRERLALDEGVWEATAMGLKTCLQNLQSQFITTAASNGQMNEDEDDDGLSYSFQVNRSHQTQEMTEMTPQLDIRDEKVVEIHLKAATSAFRLLRNACAACPLNQQACHDAQLLQLTHDLILKCCSWIDVEEQAIQDLIILLVQVALQCMVNCITNHSENQQLVWSLFFPDHFQKVLVECHSHRKIVAFTAAVLLNCINQSSERQRELVCARNLIITLLQRCLLKPISAQLPVDNLADEHDPALEWICLVFRLLFQDGGFAKDLYTAVGAHMLSRLWSRVTPEQLIVLRLFAMWIASFSSQKTTEDPFHSINSPTLEAIWSFVDTTWRFLISRDDADRPDDADKERKPLWIVLEDQAKLLFLDVMGDLTVCRRLVASNTSTALLQSLLDELRRVWSERRQSAAYQVDSTNATTGTRGSEPFGYRSAILRVIGNLCYRVSAHQDLVRDHGSLPLVLNHCNLDDQNPLIREWALVALRNLCEGNEANQQAIQALRPQGMDSQTTEYLAKTHVQAQLNIETGKIHLSQRNPPN